MKMFLNALREVYGLFVEDGSYTAALLVWLVIAAFVFPVLLGPAWRAPVWFAGLALILLENVARSARKLRLEARKVVDRIET
ncbi:MAG TPA: hypothetical protein VFC78_00555 [Tepidisphaeraceae bacterium]|nr:hypothetical protein [Tepidisphaeraceae bacterium]